MNCSTISKDVLFPDSYTVLTYPITISLPGSKRDTRQRSACVSADVSFPKRLKDFLSLFVYEILQCKKLDEVNFGTSRSLTSNTYTVRTSSVPLQKIGGIATGFVLYMFRHAISCSITKSGGVMNDLSTYSIIIPTNALL